MARAIQAAMKHSILALTLASGLVACAHENDAMKETTTVNGANSTWNNNDPASARTEPAPTGDATALGNPSSASDTTAKSSDSRPADKPKGSANSATTPAPTPPSATAPNAASGPNTNVTSSNAKAPDNTGVNSRDRGTNAPTAMTQGNSAAEIKITAAIRRAVVQSKSLGFDAKNVKIITVGTKVTLRGPVKTAQERDIIETTARQTPGVTEVDNQLELKN